MIPFKPFIALIFLISLASCKPADNNKTTKITSVAPDSVYVQTGNRIVSLTFDTLRQSLLSAIGTQGFEYAIDFCCEKAIALTNTYSDSVMVKRTSVRYRNPDNKPDSLSLRILRGWESDIKQSRKPQEQLVRNDLLGEVHFLKPIMMQAMCLNCHGKPDKNIQRSTLVKIQQRYPEDMAIDFEEGDLRGAWHLIFKSDKKYLLN